MIKKKNLPCRWRCIWLIIALHCLKILYSKILASVNTEEKLKANLFLKEKHFTHEKIDSDLTANGFEATR